ncbi:hypothetical protein TELCIR_12334 [Teladorsagia circumcincta]|uniref:Uncharacterized protein n=1 Tax=Teladorsagia circumcincta TaxID=45464 RepID=A0A2G9U6R6_TELCI|nr:hypothetical protein TELCIR_12334 [Teladorsagia circumcincta]
MERSESKIKKEKKKRLHRSNNGIVHNRITRKPTSPNDTTSIVADMASLKPKETSKIKGTHAIWSESRQVDNWVLDERMKRMIMDLQRHWLTDYQQSREKLLVEMTEKLHQEFLSDQQKIRTELLTQFKDELDTTRAELEDKYRESLKLEVAKLVEKHKRELTAAKKKQWCWQCESEASTARYVKVDPVTVFGNILIFRRSTIAVGTPPTVALNVSRVTGLLTRNSADARRDNNKDKDRRILGNKGSNEWRGMNGEAGDSVEAYMTDDYYVKDLDDERLKLRKTSSPLVD